MTIELQQISKRLGNSTHIYQTDLKLVERAFNILLGTTLSGKTSLMRLMAGLDKPTTGKVLAIIPHRQPVIEEANCCSHHERKEW